MRAFALLSLFFGVMAQMLLDGQAFTHALFGIACGIVVVVCGISSARKDYSNETRRWLGLIMASIGLVLALFCIVQLPSAYQTQTRFNERVKKIEQLRKSTQTTNDQTVHTLQ